MASKRRCRSSGVGKNLQDHLSADVGYTRKAPGPFHRDMRLDRIARRTRQSVSVRHRASPAIVPGGITAFLKTWPRVRKLPDVQFLFRAASLAAQPYLPPFPPAYRRRLRLPRRRCCGRKAAAGSRWARPIPRAAARISQNFLGVEDDLKAMRAGMRMARDVGRQPPIAPFVGAEIDAGLRTDAEIDAHIRATGITVHHPIGTCRMGSDDATPWSIPSCACAASKHCAWSTLRSCLT